LILTQGEGREREREKERGGGGERGRMERSKTVNNCRTYYMCTHVHVHACNVVYKAYM
jgi:hypothetical protein